MAGELRSRRDKTAQVPMGNPERFPAFCVANNSPTNGRGCPLGSHTPAGTGFPATRLLTTPPCVIKQISQSSSRPERCGSKLGVQIKHNETTNTWRPPLAGVPR